MQVNFTFDKMSRSNWKLYYDYSSSETQFAEVTLKDGKTFMRQLKRFFQSVRGCFPSVSAMEYS